jgi:hypothetical protein
VAERLAGIITSAKRRSQYYISYLLFISLLRSVIASSRDLSRTELAGEESPRMDPGSTDRKLIPKKSPQTSFLINETVKRISEDIKPINKRNDPHPSRTDDLVESLRLESHALIH